MVFVIILQGRCILQRTCIHGYYLMIKENVVRYWSYLCWSCIYILSMINSTWLQKNNTNVQNEISINWLSAFIWSLLTRDLLSYSCVCLSTTNVYFHVCCVIIIIHNYSVAFFQNNWYKEINISLESRIGQYSI